MTALAVAAIVVGYVLAGYVTLRGWLRRSPQLRDDPEIATLIFLFWPVFFGVVVVDWIALNVKHPGNALGRAVTRLGRWVIR